MRRNVLMLLSWLLTCSELFAQATPFYQGKTITFIVGSGAGTAYDIYARLLATYIGKYVPGNPSVVVQNMPAAGGMVAAFRVSVTAVCRATGSRQSLFGRRVIRLRKNNKRSCV
jgi:tripartite-type tricarboxylate transporter receptor subunit TctC